MQKLVKEAFDNRVIYHLIDILPKSQVAFMTKEELEKAKQNRQRQNPAYSDTDRLTDRSKVMLRRRSASGKFIKKGSDSK